MVEKLATDPPLQPQDAMTEDWTREIDSEVLSLETHAQYLDQLQMQYSIEVDHAILFYIPSQQDPVVFVNKEKIVIGRQDAKGRIKPEFDLTKFGGLDIGVSRMHAKIVREDNKYFIEDLHSTNGTRLNGNKLVPYHYMPLTDSSVLQFGRLPVNVFIVNR